MTNRPAQETPHEREQRIRGYLETGLDVERLTILRDWSAHQLNDRHVELCELCNAFLDATARLAAAPEPAEDTE